MCTFPRSTGLGTVLLISAPTSSTQSLVLKLDTPHSPHGPSVITAYDSPSKIPFSAPSLVPATSALKPRHSVAKLELPVCSPAHESPPLRGLQTIQTLYLQNPTANLPQNILLLPTSIFILPKHVGWPFIPQLHSLPKYSRKPPRLHLKIDPESGNFSLLLLLLFQTGHHYNRPEEYCSSILMNFLILSPSATPLPPV